MWTCYAAVFDVFDDDDDTDTDYTEQRQWLQAPRGDQNQDQDQDHEHEHEQEQEQEQDDDQEHDQEHEHDQDFESESEAWVAAGAWDDPLLTNASHLLSHVSVAPWLGATLRTLTISKCSDMGIWDMPSLLVDHAPNLECLEVTHGRFDTFTHAELVLPPRLTALKLTYCCIRTFEPDLLAAPALRELDISFNSLEHLPACLEAVQDRIILQPAAGTVTDAAPGHRQRRRRRHRLVLNLRNNNFWWQTGTAIPYGRLTRESLHELRRANHYGLVNSMVVLDAVRVLRLDDRTVVTKLRATHDDAQNVHMTSVQSAARATVDRIMSAPHLPPYNPGFMEHLVRRLQCSECNAKKGWRRRCCTKRCARAVAVMRIDCAKPNMRHLVLGGVEYRDLCERVLAFLEHDPQAAPVADAVFEVMREEILLSQWVCLTGKITHLLGAMNGLVPGVAIGISPREALSDTLVAIRNRWSAAAVDSGLLAYLTEAIPEATQALEDACIPEEEQAGWLDAL